MTLQKYVIYNGVVYGSIVRAPGCTLLLTRACRMETGWCPCRGCYMASSPGVSEGTSAVKSMSQFPVLPPIDGVQDRGEVRQTTAAKKEIAEKITVRKKFLRHRRSKMISEERKRRLNYMFLRQCVENRPVAPIQSQWLESIVARVSPNFKEGPETNKLLQELCKEVSEDFHNVIVKHTGIVKLVCMDV
ncbi:hypothetical protein F7725_000846 [Dissostichus mawsoni]|uniref:Uncharacterized protein n=1 Tax=Dissostichus mawsoni TaxID=36200 RepID=A0A7J5ZHH8_DISMA|nr:hypothetical protein F7725_000846 [Dissostichus mawsoni]